MVVVSGNGALIERENEMTKMLTVSEKVNTVRALLAKQHGQLENAFPIRMDPERFARIVITSCQRTPKLLDCTPQSLLAAVMVCAALGLEPDGVRNMAHLVPFGDQVTFIPGYMGLCDLALRSGKIRKIVPRVVYQGDKFAYQYGSTEFVDHEPCQAKDRGKVVAAYAIAWFTDVDDYQFEVMEFTDIESIRNRSRASKAGPWVTDWDAMAKKTVLRQLCKYLPSNAVAPELGMAVGIDEAGERGDPQVFPDAIDIDTGEILDEKSDLDKLADQHGAPPSAEPAAEPTTEPPPEPAAKKEEPPPVVTPLTTEERRFVQSFKPLRKSGTDKFWIQHHKYLMSLAEDHIIRVEFWKKYRNLLKMEPQLPSEASPAPTGPTTTPPPEPPPPSPGEPLDLFGEGSKQEKQDHLSTAEATETVNVVVDKAGHNLIEFHRFATELNAYEFDRYSKHFTEAFLKNPGSAFVSFLAWTQKEAQEALENK